MSLTKGVTLCLLPGVSTPPSQVQQKRSEGWGWGGAEPSLGEGYPPPHFVLLLPHPPSYCCRAAAIDGDIATYLREHTDPRMGEAGVRHDRARLVPCLGTASGYEPAGQGSDVLSDG